MKRKIKLNPHIFVIHRSAAAQPENSEPYLETLPDELPPQQSKPVTRRKICPEESLGFCNHCKEWTPLIWLPKEERGKKAESWFMCEFCSGRSITLRYLSGQEAVAKKPAIPILIIRYSHKHQEGRATRFAVKTNTPLTKQPISDSARTRGLFGRSDGLGNGDGWLAIHSPLNAGEGWFPPAGISMWARGRSQSIKHSGLRTDIINIVLAPPPKSLNRWICC